MADKTSKLKVTTASLTERLLAATFGACTCKAGKSTKSGPSFHDEDCYYRLFREVVEHMEETEEAVDLGFTQREQDLLDEVKRLKEDNLMLQERLDGFVRSGEVGLPKEFTALVAKVTSEATKAG